jgi:hypothetical protein
MLIGGLLVLVCFSALDGLICYHYGQESGKLAVQTDPVVPHAIKNGDVYQLSCPGDTWAIPAATPLPSEDNNDRYAVSPIAFKCVPRHAEFLTRGAEDVPGKLRIEQYCPPDYAQVPFLGSGGGGGSNLNCGRKEWLQALFEQEQRRSDDLFKNVHPKK